MIAVIIPAVSVITFLLVLTNFQQSPKTGYFEDQETSERTIALAIEHGYPLEYLKVSRRRVPHLALTAALGIFIMVMAVEIQPTHVDMAAAVVEAQARLDQSNVRLEQIKDTVLQEIYAARSNRNIVSRMWDRTKNAFVDKDPRVLAGEQAVAEADAHLEQAKKRQQEFVPSVYVFLGACLAAVVSAFHGFLVRLGLRRRWRAWVHEVEAINCERLEQEEIARVAREKQEAEAAAAAQERQRLAQQKQESLERERQKREQEQELQRKIEYKKDILEKRSMRGMIFLRTESEDVRCGVYRTKVLGSVKYTYNQETFERTRGIRAWAEDRLAELAANYYSRANALIQLRCYRDGYVWEARAAQLLPADAEEDEVYTPQEAILDGSNIFLSPKDSDFTQMSGVEALQRTVGQLKQQLGMASTIVFDHSTWRKLPKDDQAAIELLCAEKIICESGVEADPEIIKLALKHKAMIVSNDRFLDYPRAMFIPMVRLMVIAENGELALSRARPQKGRRPRNWPETVAAEPVPI